VSAVSAAARHRRDDKAQQEDQQLKEFLTVTRGLLEELADASGFREPDDRFSEQRRHREHCKGWAELSADGTESVRSRIDGPRSSVVRPALPVSTG